MTVKYPHASSIQSSSYDASKAIDGNRATYFSSNHNSEMNPWLQLYVVNWRLGITRVSIFHWQECCGKTAKKLRVMVGHLPFKKGGDNKIDIKRFNKICATYESPENDVEEISLDCKEPLEGRYVTIILMQESKTVLNLAEVEIYGPQCK